MPPSLKIVLLFLGAISHRLGLKPPTPPPSKEDNVFYKGQPFEKVARLMSLISQVSVITCLMSECAVLLSVYYQNPYSPRILSSLCPGSSPSLSTLSIVSPSFLLGISIMLSSAAFRVWCYDTLGSFFTFEVTIKRTHKLITSGPYAYVRHPGYTAAVVMFVGATVTCMAPGGYIDECDIMATKAGWWVRMWLGCALFVTASLWRRGRIEDGGLRRAFGEVWDDYSQAVPCRFVPGLL